MGRYEAIDPDLRSKLDMDEQKIIGDIEKKASKNALMSVAVLPIIMLISYIFLIFYFRRRGGYRVVDLKEAQS